jgi:hypothetical protein
MLDEITMQRLSLIQYIYESAMEESRKPEPFGLISILKFHDSVELFLDLACDKFGIPAKKTQQFRDYWTELEKHLQNQSLSEKRSMERLNDARVSFKHHGNLPHVSSREKFRVNVTDFFEENTLLIFGIEISKISMTYLVQNSFVKTLLDEARELMEQGARGKAIDKIALAFADLMLDYRRSAIAQGHRSLFSFGRSVRNLSSSDVNNNRQLEEFTQKVASSIEELRESMGILSLGLDYQQYARFKLLTPYTVLYSGSEHYVVASPTEEGHAPSLEHCQFCFDFVVSSAIRIQSTDLDV